MVATLEDRLVVGDGSALRDLFDEFAPLISGIGEDILGPDRADAVDPVTADVLSEAWNTRAEFDPSKGSVRSWLVAMTRVRLADELGLSVAEAEHQFGAQIDRHVVASTIDGMPEVRRELVARGLFRGESEERMAAELDLPMGSVAGHLRRGLELLRDELADSMPPGADVMDRLEDVVDAGRLERASVPPSSAVWDLVLARTEVNEAEAAAEFGDSRHPADDEPPTGSILDEWSSPNAEAGFDRTGVDAETEADDTGVSAEEFLADFAAGSVSEHDEWVDGSEHDDDPAPVGDGEAWADFMSVELANGGSEPADAGLIDTASTDTAFTDTAFTDTGLTGAAEPDSPEERLAAGADDDDTPESLRGIKALQTAASAPSEANGSTGSIGASGGSSTRLVLIGIAVISLLLIILALAR